MKRELKFYFNDLKRSVYKSNEQKHHLTKKTNSIYNGPFNIDFACSTLFDVSARKEI
jgi:hypothetical protein